MNRTEQIFTERFLPLYPRLYAVAVAILGPARGDAADAVQDVMVRIWRLGDAMAMVAEPEAYAVRAVRNTAIDILRKRTPISDTPPDSPGDTLPEPDTAAFIRRMVDALPDAQREVVSLNAFAGLSAAEIADLTGNTPGNVRLLLCRGRRKIREMYNKYMQS